MAEACLKIASLRLRVTEASSHSETQFLRRRVIASYSRNSTYSVDRPDIKR